MSQIYVKANDDTQLQNLKAILEQNKFKVEYASGEWRFMPVLIDFSKRIVGNITSASMCHCMFNVAKKSLIDFKDFETILSLNKEN